MATKREMVTPEFRISFPALFRPEAQEGQEPKFKITMLFPAASSPALEPIRQRMREVLAEKWPDPKSKPAKLRNPLRDGNEKAHIAGYKDMIFCTATAQADRRPKIVGADMGEILEEAKVYAGSYARAVIEVFAYNRNGNAGIGLGLVMVQWLRDGEPFGRSYGTPEEYFGAGAVQQVTAAPADGDFF